MFGKTETTTIAVEGMTCGHCQKRVADALRAVKGVKSVEVSLEKKSAEVSLCPVRPTVRSLCRRWLRPAIRHSEKG